MRDEDESLSYLFKPVLDCREFDTEIDNHRGTGNFLCFSHLRQLMRSIVLRGYSNKVVK